MKRPALGLLLVVQTAVLVLVAWAAVYFARDEFLLLTARHEAPPEAVPLDDGDDGVPSVRLGAAAQRNVGIETAALQAASVAGSTDVPVSVLDVQALAELHGRLQAARHEAEAARITATASAAEQARVQGLFDDDRNASQRALEAATAQAAADRAREHGAQATLAALRESARAAWGAQLATWLTGDAAPLARLWTGQDVLLRASLRADDSVPASAALQLQLPGGGALAATPLGPAAADASGGTRSLLYRAALARAGSLVPGMQLSARLATSAARESGALVPASAIVWHAGQPWVYVRESGAAEQPAAPAGPASAASGKVRPAKPADDDDDAPRKPPAAAVVPATAASAAVPLHAASAADAFQRRAVPLARRIGDQWFLPGFTEDDPVVVRGAQVLLSQELRFQIRNENDD